MGERGGWTRELCTVETQLFKCAEISEGRMVSPREHLKSGPMVRFGTREGTENAGV
jgi:hypothetical protein